MPHLSQKHLKDAAGTTRQLEIRHGTAVFEKLKAQLTKSLRELCGKRGSINVVCKDLNINRQQFAKYLSGTNLPSAYIIQRLALYFSVDPSVFFISPNRRHRFSTEGALRLQVAPELAEGFYLEHTLWSPDSLAIGLWRLERHDTMLCCHGEIPRHREGRQVMFDSFNGEVVNSYQQHQLIAASQCGYNTVILALMPFELGGQDLLAARMTRLGREEIIQSTPSMLRYLGSKVDIAHSLTTACGIRKLSALDERSASIFEMLSKRVAQFGNGFRLAP